MHTVHCPQAAEAPGRRQDEVSVRAKVRILETWALSKEMATTLIPDKVSDRELEQVLAQRRLQREQQGLSESVTSSSTGLKSPETKPSDPMYLWIFVSKVLQYDLKWTLAHKLQLFQDLCYMLLGAT